MSTAEVLFCVGLFIVVLGLLTLSDKPGVKKIDNKKYWKEKERKWKNDR